MNWALGLSGSRGLAAGQSVSLGVVDGSGVCAEVPYQIKAFTFTQNASDTVSSWFGTVLSGKENGTGTLYRRNRYLDPATGRFTQEDPIGLAGGANLYGFADGDPVNFSDPFGLLACDPPGSLLCLVASDVARRTAPLKTFVEGGVGEVTGVNALGRAAERLTGGNVAGGAAQLAMAVPVVRRASATVQGTKAGVRAGLGALGRGEKVTAGVRGVLSSGRADQVMVEAATDGGATVFRWVRGNNQVSSAMYQYIIDQWGKVVGVAKQAYDKAGAIAGTLKTY